MLCYNDHVCNTPDYNGYCIVTVCMFDIVLHVLPFEVTLYCLTDTTQSCSAFTCSRKFFLLICMSLVIYVQLLYYIEAA